MLDFIYWLDREGRVVVQFQDGTRGTQQDEGLRGKAWARATLEADDMRLDYVYEARFLEEEDQLTSVVWPRAFYNRVMPTVKW